jgi:hypothetical protein
MATFSEKQGSIALTFSDYSASLEQSIKARYKRECKKMRF